MIYFDIDSTLMNHELAEQSGAVDFYHLNKDELPFTEETFLRKWKMSSDYYFEKYLKGEISFTDQRRLRIRALFGEEKGALAEDALFNEYLTYYEKNWSIYLDVCPCLSNLREKGYKLGVISNGDKLQQMKKLNQLEIASFFDIVVTSSETNASKPDKHIFETACKLANVSLTDSYYIGDRLDIDAIASLEAGMTGIWLNRLDMTTSDRVTVIHSLNDLVKVLERG